MIRDWQFSVAVSEIRFTYGMLQFCRVAPVSPERRSSQKHVKSNSGTGSKNVAELCPLVGAPRSGESPPA